MISIRKLPAWAKFGFVAAAVLVGCGGGEYFKLGQKAEQKGDSATAYDQYARAAAQHRSGAVADALARTRHAATAQAERAGLEAMDEERYDDAWRAFMRTLDIQPDHATAVELVHQLERDYPEEIASAKRDWLIRGSASLSVARTRQLAMASPPPPVLEPTLPPARLVRDQSVVEKTKATPETRSAPKVEIASLPPKHKERPSSPPPPVLEPTAPPIRLVRDTSDVKTAKAIPVASRRPEIALEPEAEIASLPPKQKEPPSSPPPPAPALKLTASPEKPVQDTSVVVVAQATVASKEPTEEPWPALKLPQVSSSRPKQFEITPPPPKRAEGSSPPVVLAKESSPAPTVPEKPLRSSKKKARTIKDQPLEPTAPPEPVPFTSIHTLSLKDRRYARMALAVDGIGVKLKDTGGGGEADLDLFDGKKRIQKVRDLELGRSQTFRGKSGTLYRLTLLGVHQRSRTIRLGVRRT